MMRLVLERGQGKVPTAILYLKISNDGQFISSAPILTDKDAFSKYLLEVKIAQNIGGTIYYQKTQRFNLSTPAEVNDKDLGWCLQIPCESIAGELINDTYLALNQQLVAPKTRIASLLFYVNTPYPDTGSVRFNYDTDADILLPNQDSLKRDYFPDTQESLGDSFQEVIDTLKLEGAEGGVFTEYYYYTSANEDYTLLVNIHFEQFGSVDSGVTITSLGAESASLLDRTNQTSYKKRKNKVIVKFNQRYGSMPSQFALFASMFAHATARVEWDGSTLYNQGDTVKYTFTSENPYVIRYFMCRVNMSVNLGPPDTNSTQWQEDFTIIPNWSADARYTPGEIVSVPGLGSISFYRCINQQDPGTPSPPNSNWASSMNTRVYSSDTYVDFFSCTPWTSNLDAFTSSLCGKTTVPDGYIGFVPDWNYERQINDLLDYTNRFLLVSGKSFRRMVGTPPSGRELYNGMRVIVDPLTASGEFAGHGNQVAEFEIDPIVGTLVGGTWQFSSNPVENDVVFNIERAEMWRFDGSDWVFAWNAVGFNDKPGVFHIVKSAYLVQGATGIPGQAVRYRFELPDALSGGNDLNKTSRFAGVNMFYPYPVQDVDGFNLGSLYGGDGTKPPNNPMVDHQNLSFTQTGQMGYNASDSETMGRISQHAGKIRIGFFQSSDEAPSSIVYGKSNIPLVYWRKDVYGRMFFQDIVVPENYQWFPFTIQLPPFGPTQLYYNRLDELVTLFGFTLPFDFFIQEKDFSGVKYEWRENQSWGIMTKESFLATGMYQGCYQNIFDQAATVVGQILPISIKGIEDLAIAANLGNSDAVRKAAMDDFNNLNINPHGVDHITIDLDELHYNKEGLAIYPDTPVEEPRMDVVHLENEDDYLTAKARAQAQYVQDQFFPNERYPDITGDVRIDYGLLVTEQGSRVPGGSLTSVVANIKDTIDTKGLNTELYLIRKFVIS